MSFSKELKQTCSRLVEVLSKQEINIPYRAVYHGHEFRQLIHFDKKQTFKRSCYSGILIDPIHKRVLPKQSP